MYEKNDFVFSYWVQVVMTNNHHHLLGDLVSNLLLRQVWQSWLTFANQPGNQLLKTNYN